MTKQIEIEVLRVSSDGQYIEFIINAPSDYQFNESGSQIADGFSIQVYGSDDIYSVADSVFYKTDSEGNKQYITDTDNRFRGQIPVSLLQVDSPKIYTITLNASLNCEDCSGSDYPETLTAVAYISDVRHAYDCLMDDIRTLDGACADTEAQDRAIRNYLILYAHQEALMLEEIQDAQKWFDMIQNCFKSGCGCTTDRSINRGCGCARNAHFSVPTKQSAIPACGCLK